MPAPTDTFQHWVNEVDAEVTALVNRWVDDWISGYQASFLIEANTELRNDE